MGRDLSNKGTWDAHSRAWWRGHCEHPRVLARKPSELSKNVHRGDNPYEPVVAIDDEQPMHSLERHDLDGSLHGISWLDGKDLGRHHVTHEPQLVGAPVVLGQIAHREHAHDL